MEAKLKLGYKRAKKNRLVVLEILGENTESRQKVVDPRYAKFRTSRAKVVSITDFKDPSIEYKDATSSFECIPEFIYRVGEIVVPRDKYDPDEEGVCARGIHYFLSKEAANYFSKPIDTFDDPMNREWKGWDDNGRLSQIVLYKNGIMDCRWTCDEITLEGKWEKCGMA